MAWPSSFLHIILGVGNPSALQVRLIFWFSRIATVDCVLSPSKIFGGTEKNKSASFRKLLFYVIYTAIQGFNLKKISIMLYTPTTRGNRWCENNISQSQEIIKFYQGIHLVVIIVWMYINIIIRISYTRWPFKYLIFSLLQPEKGCFFYGKINYIKRRLWYILWYGCIPYLFIRQLHSFNERRSSYTLTS